jgi:hypothetical protein
MAPERGAGETSGSMSEQEKTTRGASRFKAGLPAVARIDGVEYACVAHDLSRAGVLLCGPLPRPTRERIEVTLRTPDGKIEATLPGTLARFDESDAGGEARLGLSFGKLGEKQTAALNLMVSRIVEGMAPAAFHALSPDSSPQAVREALEKVTLAHRIALAARATAAERRYLVHDPNPKVAEALARNPNTPPPELKSLARRRNLLPTTLEMMARDGRCRDEELRLLVASHPNCPLPIVTKMVEGMNDVVLRKLLMRPGLNPAIRNRLMAKMARRRGPA